MMTLDREEVKERRKSHTYSTSAQLVGDKVGTLRAEGKTPLTVSSPPEFKGPPDLWTPEDLFVGALEMCHMLTFMALVQRRRLGVLSYVSKAEGTLEVVDGAYRFTRVVITPTIRVGDPADALLMQSLIDETHAKCLISNSVSTSVEFIPEILVQ